MKATTATVVNSTRTRQRWEKLDVDGVETRQAISPTAPMSERIGAPARR